MTGESGTINLVLAALGGEGGGVLTDWVIDVADREGWLCQSTSLAGVAQRTGATIYYLEMYPRDAISGDTLPVMSLFPAQGDIDIAIASEIAEAGRMVQRGFVTPEKTTLIASDHRVYGITEKIELGDGVVDAAALRAIAGRYAKDYIHFDMLALANEHQTVISAVLFGALAGSGVLPFARETYEAVITASGKAVAQNMAAFAASYARAQARGVEEFVPGSSSPPAPSEAATLPSATTGTGQRLLDRIQALPAGCREVLHQGVVKLVDYQDHDYAAAYLDTVEQMVVHDPQARDPGSAACELTTEFARYLALLMAFEDIPRVAQLKTRPGRMDKVRSEVRADAGQLLHVTEFFRPRVEEICSMLPAALGRRALASPGVWRLLRPFTGGRKLRTDSVSVFLTLRTLAGLRRWRRGSLAYATAHALIDRWVQQVLRAAAAGNLALALELAECGRLVKGYGDTHARTTGQLNLILEYTESDTGITAARVARLREAAFADDDNSAFSAALSGADSADRA
ncbi:MAG: indolepyruvate oxidoreductase subunit beta family protein, partial [Chromatocurvus sp.]